MSQFITYKNSEIHYTKFGSGKELMICLHGFGEEADSFLFLEKVMGTQFTAIAINMPFHGLTNWNEGLLFSPEDLHEIIKTILENFKSIVTPKDIHFFAYSMGGRLALSYFQQYPYMVKSMALVAPDGLHKNNWYWFATQTAIGNRLFKFTMHLPKWFVGMVKVLGNIGLLNKSVAKFVSYYLGDESIRTALYKRWTTLRKFRPNLPLIKKLAVENNVPINMLFGEFDRIILYQRGQKFQVGQEALITVKVINAGHQLLQEKYVTDIAKLLVS